MAAVSNPVLDEDIMEESCSSSSDSDSSCSESSCYDSDSDDEVDYTRSSYNIAVEKVTSKPNLSDVDNAWKRVVEGEEDSHFDVDFDESCAGTKHIGQAKEPIDFFNLLFTSYLWYIIIGNTNKYAKAEKLKNWKDVNKKDMMAFMAIFFNMGLIRKNSLNDYWSKRGCMSTPWFRFVMSRDRFKRILRSFHIVDNSTLPNKEDPVYRPSCRVRPLLEYFNAICMHYFSPYQAIAIDESLIAGKVRNPIRQYLPNKHHARFGTKVWLLADSKTAYVLKCYVYEGAKYDQSSGIAGTGYDVVCRLMEMGSLYNKCHHLFTDNLFTTYAAANLLLDQGTFLTGTMRRNQLQHLPKEISIAKPKLGESIYYRRDRYLAMSYRQKKSQNKPVIMLSTFCGAFNVPHRKKKDKSIPAIVDMYNQSMGGVDSSDQVMYSYSTERKSKSWSKKVVFALLSRLLMNSYILYQQTVDKPKSRLEFIKDIIDSLANESKVSEMPAESSTTPKLIQLSGKKERDCAVCSDRKNNIRRRSTYSCSMCNKGVHTLCFVKHKCQK